MNYESDFDKMRKDISRLENQIIPQRLQSQETSLKAQQDKAIHDLDHSFKLRLDSRIREEVKNQMEYAKAEHKKQLQQLQFDYDQKLEKLRDDFTSLS